MAAVSEATTEVPGSAAGTVSASGTRRPAITGNRAKAVALVVATAAMWLVMIAILIAI